MSGPARRADVARFARAIAALIGLQFDEARFDRLGDVLVRRLAALGLTRAAYLSWLDAGAADAELAALACELTVGETYFFRNREQFRALAEIVLPERLGAGAACGGGLRLLSAGCASGEEAYSLAIVAHETVGDTSPVSILGVDLNPAALARAAAARYSPWALRETPADTRLKWFRGDGGYAVPAAPVREAVAFARRNLVAPDCDVWQPGAYDAVFCRNVIMYFAPAQARALLARIAASLRPGGYLFLGHAETLRGLADGFCLQHTHGTFYYRLGAADAAPLAEPAALPAPAPQVRRRLAAARPQSTPAAPAPAGAPPAAACGDGEALLAEAVQLAHRGRLEPAEKLCRRLLAADPGNAGAHYLLALCRDSAGDGVGATEHDHAAATLDPGFALPRLHLGLVARRLGARDLACRELARALDLLPHETGARLALFGGDFTRDTLMSLCRSALEQCGGAP